MQITEVRIKLMDEGQQNGNERLQAFCSITFDNAFVVRDLKIIEGTKGSFVAMPSRKLTDRCGCGTKNPLRSRYCTHCGRQLDENRATRDVEGRAKLHADIAHPINSRCREMIQSAVLREFQAERERAKQPGYVSTYDDLDNIADDGSYAELISRLDVPADGSAGPSRAAARPHQRSGEPITSAPLATERPSDGAKPASVG